MAYQLLPFRFERFNENEYLLTNEVGEYLFLSNEDFHSFVHGGLDEHSELFYDLASKQIATTDKVEDVVQMLATKFRTKKSILRDFTSLHMVVPTLRCNSSCIYCQVARKNIDDHSANMTKKTAKKRPRRQRKPLKRRGYWRAVFSEAFSTGWKSAMCRRGNQAATA